MKRRSLRARPASPSLGPPPKDRAADPRALEAWREARQLTQAQLAMLLGVSRSRVCEIEAGKGCSLKLAIKIEKLTKGAVRPQDVEARRQVRRAGKADAEAAPPTANTTTGEAA